MSTKSSNLSILLNLRKRNRTSRIKKKKKKMKFISNQSYKRPKYICEITEIFAAFIQISPDSRGASLSERRRRDIPSPSPKVGAKSTFDNFSRGSSHGVPLRLFSFHMKIERAATNRWSTMIARTTDSYRANDTNRRLRIPGLQTFLV